MPRIARWLNGHTGGPCEDRGGLADARRLGNLTAIVDVNRLGQRGPTELGWALDAHRARAEAFGCRALTLDGVT